MKPTIKSNLANGRNVHIKRKEETNLKSDEEVEVVCDGGSAINGVTVSSFLFFLFSNNRKFHLVAGY